MHQRSGDDQWLCLMTSGEQRRTKKETGKVFLLIQRHTAPVLRLLTSASLALEGSEDTKSVSEKSLGLKVALFWYPDCDPDDDDQRN